MERIKYIFLGLAIILALLVVAEIINQEVVSHKYEEWQTAVFPNHRDSKCVNGAGIGFEIDVVTEEETGQDYNGRYFPMRNTIVLVDTSLDTIAHESYHATQDILREYDLEDVNEEYGGYLQGSLTACVADIVMSKLENQHAN